VCQNASDPLTPCLPEPKQQSEEIENGTEQDITNTNNNININNDYLTQEYHVDHQDNTINNNIDNFNINNFKSTHSTDIDQPPLNNLN